MSETTTETDPGSPYGRRKAHTPARHTIAKVVLSTVVVLAMVTGLSVVFLYRHLNDNLTVLDPTSALTDRPTKQQSIDQPDAPQEPLNILVMGSDSRDGAGNNIDGLTGEGARSDTTILVHLSADRKNAYGISIPRDSLVDRPECTKSNGDKIAGSTGVMWNEAFSVGGPLCTVQQFEQITGVFVDDFVVVDFNGFRDMVDAIGGVKVCIPEPIVDPAHGINIPAGTRDISGYEALNYVRARYTLGDGSDTARIKRQQAFIASMAAKVVSGGVLGRLDRLVGFLDAATKSLIVSPGLSNVLKIGQLGLGFRNIGLSNIRFSTIPNMPYPADPNRLVWTPAAKDVWKKIAADEPLTTGLGETVISADDVPGTSDGGSDPSGSPSASPSGGADTARAQELAAAGLCS